MAAAIELRIDFSGDDLRRFARSSRDAKQVRRLLALAVIRDGGSRTEAARIGGVGLQIVRDWVLRFNAEGPDGLKDIRSKGHRRRLAPDQLTALAEIAETGPDRAKDGVVRWRRVDLKRMIEERFGVVYHERTIGKLLKQLGFSHISARPRHPGQKAETIAAFKKTLRRR